MCKYIFFVSTVIVKRKDNFNKLFALISCSISTLWSWAGTILAYIIQIFGKYFEIHNVFISSIRFILRGFNLFFIDSSYTVINFCLSMSVHYIYIFITLQTSLIHVSNGSTNDATSEGKFLSIKYVCVLRETNCIKRTCHFLINYCKILLSIANLWWFVWQKVFIYILYYEF